MLRVFSEIFILFSQPLMSGSYLTDIARYLCQYGYSDNLVRFELICSISARILRNKQRT